MSALRPELDYAAPAAVDRWQRTALIVGVLGSVGALLGWVIETDIFYQSYLLGYMWCLGFTLGPLALLMVYHMTGGAWGTLGRRIMEAATRTLPLMVLFFIPIIIGMHHLYPWARPETVKSDPDLQRLAQQYLSRGFVIFRAAIYFLLWGTLTYALNKISDRQNQAPEMNFDVRLRSISAAGFVIYAFTITFAAVDWSMSVDPHWASTIYGMLFMAGHGILAFAFVALVGAGLKPYKPMADAWKPDQFLDYGKLLLAMCMMWGWFTLSQWLIIWSGNLPDEISFYLNRTRGGWSAFAYAVVIIEFFIPFFLLLSRGLKSDWRKLRWLALWLIAARYIDLYYIIMPSFENRKGHFHYSWLDAVVPLAMLGLWLAYFFYNLKRRPLLAVYDAHVRVILEKEPQHDSV